MRSRGDSFSTGHIGVCVSSPPRHYFSLTYFCHSTLERYGNEKHIFSRDSEFLNVCLYVMWCPHLMAGNYPLACSALHGRVCHWDHFLLIVYYFAHPFLGRRVFCISQFLFFAFFTTRPPICFCLPLIGSLDVIGDLMVFQGGLGFEILGQDLISCGNICSLMLFALKFWQLVWQLDSEFIRNFLPSLSCFFSQTVSRIHYLPLATPSIFLLFFSYFFIFSHLSLAVTLLTSCPHSVTPTNLIIIFLKYNLSPHIHVTTQLWPIPPQYTKWFMIPTNFIDTSEQRGLTTCRQCSNCLRIIITSFWTINITQWERREKL